MTGTLLCAKQKNRWNYTTENHKKCRTVIYNWIDEGDFIDTYRTFHPDRKSYTYRVREAESKKIIIQARLDYALASSQLFGRVTEIQHINPSFSFSDHSGVRVKIMIEKFPEGPGTFRANPFIEQDCIYDASTRHLISQELLEMTSLRREKENPRD